ncbi:ECF transporter S component [Furfurilactobacillus entadae]|uniref:ECF transporter S component n=1 Tax=Furfurilactobacillus entadae TaxID=2922307 RepID=UPI0035EB8F8F
MGNTALRRMIGVAVLGAVAAVVMFIEFPILPGATFMKLDLSLLIILLGTILYGLGDGVLIAVIAVVLHLLFKGVNPFSLIGDSIALVANIAYVLPLYWLLKKVPWRRGVTLSVGILVSTVLLTVIMTALNGWLMFPLYIQAGGLPQTTDIAALLVSVVVPFNLLKGLIIGGAFWVVYVRMEPWLNRQHQQLSQSHADVH